MLVISCMKISYTMCVPWASIFDKRKNNFHLFVKASNIYELCITLNLKHKPFMILILTFIWLVDDTFLAELGRG